MRKLGFSPNRFVSSGCALHRVPVRRGVTVLEVMFSIGIVAVGLLGVLIIVPLAGLRSTQGVIADGADRMGRNAIRAFDVCQMRRQDNWAQLNSSTTYAAFIGGEPFAIDPLYMAVNSSTTGIERFPYLGSGTPPSGVPYMKRISLCAYPGATLPSPAPGMTGSRIMTASQAEAIFLGDDDLVFSLPQDRTLPAVQKFDSAGLKRQWEGKFSWLATLVPKPGLPDRYLYLLSIVVFHRRDPSADGERTVPAAPVPSTTTLGFNGGDVLLTSSVEDDLKMKEGEWLMLTGIDSTGRKHFRWYHIQSGDAGDSAGTGERNLTLFGQDWAFGDMTGSNGTRAVWIPGVVAVYEKTIRLETSSLWTNF